MSSGTGSSSSIPDLEPDEDLVRIPRQVLTGLEDYLRRSIRRMADTPGVETQELSREGEAVLLGLAAVWAVDDTRVALWGATGERPSLPSKPMANGGGRG